MPGTTARDAASAALPVTLNGGEEAPAGAAPTDTIAGLRMRLEDGTLKRDEKVKLEQVRKILEMRAEGVSLKGIADTLGMKHGTLVSFTGRNVYRTMSAWLARKDETDLDATEQRDTRIGDLKTKRRFRRFAPQALDFIESCFQKDKKGAYADRGDAAWATKMVADGHGWTEAAPARVAKVELKFGVKIVQQAARKDDVTVAGEVIVVESTPV